MGAWKPFTNKPAAVALASAVEQFKAMTADMGDLIDTAIAPIVDSLSSSLRNIAQTDGVEPAMRDEAARALDRLAAARQTLLETSVRMRQLGRAVKG